MCSGASLICHGRCQTPSVPLPLSVSKQDFREFRPSPSLTLSHFLPPLSPLRCSSPISHLHSEPHREREERAFFAPQLFLPLWLAHFALNVPNSRENGRAIETAQQKKVIIKLAPKMTLTGVGRQDPFAPSLFGPFFTSSQGGFEFPRRQPRRRHQIQFVVAVVADGVASATAESPRRFVVASS